MAFYFIMFYIFHGQNVEESLRKRARLLQMIRQKKPFVDTVALETSDVSSVDFNQLSARCGLFEPCSIYMIDSALSDATTRALIIDNIEIIAKSHNVFIFFEREGLSKSVLDKLETLCAKVYLSSHSTEFQKVNDNRELFALADALSSRAKKDLWIRYSEVMLDGKSSEEVLAILFWQVKALMIARASTSASQAKLSPFVYAKAVRQAHKWSQDKLKALAWALVVCFHDSRRGVCNMQDRLEKIILSI
jgi:hypothetical protein